MSKSAPRWNPQTQSWEFGPPSAATGGRTAPPAPPVPPAPPAGPPPYGPSGPPGGAPEGASGGDPADGPADPPAVPGQGGAPGGGAPTVPGQAVAPGYESGAEPPTGYAPGPPGGYGPGQPGGFGPAPGGPPGLPAYPPGAPGYEPGPGGMQPPPSPPRPAGRGGWLTPLTAGVAVAALAAGAGVVWFVQRGDSPAPRATASLSAPPASSAADGSSGPSGNEASTSPSDSPSPSASAPAGYSVVDDTAGFKIAVPEGWQREELKTGVFYRSADRASLVQVFRVDEPGMTARQAVQGASDGLSGNPGYRQIEITDTGTGSAELQYEYDSAETGSRRRGIERVLTTSDGRMYAVLVAAPASEWPRQREIQTAALGAFVPTS